MYILALLQLASANCFLEFITTRTFEVILEQQLLKHVPTKHLYTHKIILTVPLYPFWEYPFQKCCKYCIFN